MTAEEKTKLLSDIDYFSAFVQKELFNPQADLPELEARYVAFLKNYNKLDHWLKYQTAVLSQLRISPPWSILQSEYRQLLSGFLKIFRSEVDSTAAVELPYQNTAPEQLKLLVEEYETQKQKQQELAEYYRRRVRELLKTSDQINFVELQTKFPDLKQNDLVALAQVINEEVLRDRIEAAVNTRQPTRTDDRKLAQKVIARQKTLLAGITSTGEEFSPPPELISTAKQILKIPRKQLAEAVTSSAAIIDRHVSPEELIITTLPETVQPASVISDHLIREVRFVSQTPVTDSTPKGHQDIISARLTQSQLSAVVPIITNIQARDPDFIKGQPEETVPKLVVAIQKLIKPPNGKQLSQEAVLSILSFIYNPPSSPEKGKLLGWALQAATFTNLPPLIPENQDFTKWLENNRETLTKHVDFWHRYFKSPDAPKNQLVPNKNLLSKDFKQQYLLLLGNAKTALVPTTGSFRSLVSRMFSFVSGGVSLGPSIKGATSGMGRSLSGLFDKGLGSILGFRGGGVGGAVVSKIIPPWVKLVIGVVAALVVLLVLDYMPVAGMGSTTQDILVDTTALIPAAGINNLPGADPDLWQPPGTGDYIPPEGCDPTYSGPVCCVPNAGFCSMEFLEPYFGQYGTEELVAASQICFRESVGGLAGVLNDSCLPCKPENGTCTGRTSVKWPVQTLDYSVGLFQINLIADGNCGVEPLPGINGPSDCSTTNPNDPLMQTGCCKITDTVALQGCFDKYSNPIINIQRALSKLRFDEFGNIIWYPTWGAARTCGYDDNAP